MHTILCTQLQFQGKLYIEQSKCFKIPITHFRMLVIWAKFVKKTSSLDFLRLKTHCTTRLKTWDVLERWEFHNYSNLFMKLIGLSFSYGMNTVLCSLDLDIRKSRKQINMFIKNNTWGTKIECCSLVPS